VIGVVAGTAGVGLPRETRIILGLDAFLVTLVALTYVMTSVVTADRCMAMARQRPAIRHTTVIGCLLATLVGVATIAVMLHSQKGEVHWLRIVHLAGSLLALVLGWFAAQMTFAVQYMRIYYKNLLTEGGGRNDPDLVFPGQARPDLQDFMYYSFTIGMCYQTSDVSINGTTIRRLTLVHAVYSFFFVATFIGFVVNVLSSLT
jgi:uncharacterized membrane protein